MIIITVIIYIKSSFKDPDGLTRCFFIILHNWESLLDMLFRLAKHQQNMGRNVKVKHLSLSKKLLSPLNLMVLSLSLNCDQPHNRIRLNLKLSH